MTKPDISPRQRRFIAAMLTARTIAGAARQAGIVERTAHRYLADPRVRAVLDQILDQALSHAARQATTGMSQAVDLLHTILADDGAPPTARIAAARVLLLAGPRLHEAVALTQRLAALENEMKEEDPWI
jgi:hypothetical protein